MINETFALLFHIFRGSGARLQPECGETASSERLLIREKGENIYSKPTREVEKKQNVSDEKNRAADEQKGIQTQDTIVPLRFKFKMFYCYKHSKATTSPIYNYIMIIFLI